MLEQLSLEMNFKIKILILSLVFFCFSPRLSSTAIYKFLPQIHLLWNKFKMESMLRRYQLFPFCPQDERNYFKE